MPSPLSFPIYGGILVNGNAVVTTMGASPTPVQITIFDTDGPAAGTIPDHTNDHVTIQKAGDYRIYAPMTIDSVAGAASTAEVTIQVNNGSGALAGCTKLRRDLAGGAGEAVPGAAGGIATLAAADTLELWIANLTGTENYTVIHAGLFLEFLG